MINLNENSDAVGRIMEVIAESYQWPDYPRAATVKRPLAVRKKAEALAPFQGYYEFSNNNMIRITAQENKLIGQMNGSFFDDFLPAEDGDSSASICQLRLSSRRTPGARSRTSRSNP